jgi:hypothetical protein
LSTSEEIIRKVEASLAGENTAHIPAHPQRKKKGTPTWLILAEAAAIFLYVIWVMSWILSVTH